MYHELCMIFCIGDNALLQWSRICFFLKGQFIFQFCRSIQFVTIRKTYFILFYFEGIMQEEKLSNDGKLLFCATSIKGTIRLSATMRAPLLLRLHLLHTNIRNDFEAEG